MTLDLWLAALVALFALMGLFSGAIKQVAQWLAVALAYLVVKPLASAAAPSLAPKLGLPAAFGPVAVVALAMLAVFLLGAPMFRLLLTKLLPAREKTAGDRAAGLALGALKGAALVFVGLSVLVSFEKPLAESGHDLARATEGSRAVDFARRHNLFDTLKLPMLDAAKQLAAARSDPNAARALLQSPALQAALDDPALKAAFADPGLQAALRSADPSTLLQNPQVKKLLEDPRLTQSLARLEHTAQSETGRTTHGP